MRYLLAVVLALALPVAGTATDVTAGLQRCATEQDSLRRLDCYDTLAKSLPGGSAASSEAAASPRTTSATTSERYSTRCQGITKKGAQCKRNASPGSNYCYQHR